jgi:WD40 repeat protein
VYQLAFSPDGALLASCGREPPLRLSDAATGVSRWREVPTTRREIGLGLAYAPDGRRIALVDWDQVFVHSARTGAIGKQFPGSGYAVAFTPDGSGLLVKAPGHRGRDIRLCHLASEKVEPVPGLEVRQLSRLAWSPDGRFLAAIADDLILYDWIERRQVEWAPLRGHSAGSAGLAFHPDGHVLVCSDGARLLVLDRETLEPVAERKRSRKHIQDAAFTPDGRFLLTVSNEATAVVWETTGWTAVQEHAWEIGPLKAVAVAPDGFRAACGSERGRVVLWDLDL